MAQLVLGEVCGVGSAEQCRGESSAGRGPRHELGVRAEGRGVCTEELRPRAMADSDGGEGRDVAFAVNGSTARRWRGRARATGKMAAAQAQRCFKMVAGARLGREGEVGVGGACAVTSRTGRSPGYGKSGTVTKARRVFPLPGKNADLREDPDGQDHHP